MTVLDWNQWRADYDKMSFAEHQAFNAECLKQHPVQQSFDTRAVDAFVQVHKPRTVVELGGWDGALADKILWKNKHIIEWRNIDITPDVPQVCLDDRYSVEVLSDWPWRQQVQADALIASHVFEHMKLAEIEWLLTEWEFDRIYADIPLYTEATDWDGYEGSHILEVSMGELVTALHAHTPYRCFHGEGTVLWLERHDI